MARPDNTKDQQPEAVAIAQQEQVQEQAPAAAHSIPV